MKGLTEPEVDYAQQGDESAHRCTQPHDPGSSGGILSLRI